MLASPGIGITGNAALDGLFPHVTYEVQNRKVIIRTRTQTYVVETEGRLRPGDKIRGSIPKELWSLVGDFRLGGGGPNSCRACKLAHPAVPIRYLEACAPHEYIQRRLDYPGLHTRFLELNEVSMNIVLGTPSNRAIVKAAPAPAYNFGPEHVSGLDWLAESGFILGNSIRRIEVAEYLTMAAAEGKIVLHVVLTPYLPPDFVTSRWLREANVVYASQDEIGRVMGWEIDPSLAGAVEVVGRLRPLAQRAVIYLTRGDDGVVVSMPDQADCVHVRLGRDWDQIQAHVARDSTVLCGAGDAFAAGAALWWRTGYSLLGDGSAAHPPAVTAAIAASALAVRWSGWLKTLCGSDFTVRALTKPGAVVPLRCPGDEIPPVGESAAALATPECGAKVRGGRLPKRSPALVSRSVSGFAPPKFS